jgi:hypothetical protein
VVVCCCDESHSADLEALQLPNCGWSAVSGWKLKIWEGLVMGALLLYQPFGTQPCNV